MLKDKEELGRVHGRTDGALEVIRFLRKEVTLPDDAVVQKLASYYDVKDARLSVVEVNGVRTVQVD